MSAAQDAAVTIAMRLPILASAVTFPTASSTAEIRRAVDEKVSSAVEGTLAMSRAWHGLWWDMMLGRTDAHALPRKLLAIAERGAKPARRRVRANARRLTGND